MTLYRLAGTFGEVLKQGEDDETMIIWFEFNSGGDLVDDDLFELSCGHDFRENLLKILGWWGLNAFFAVVLDVSEKEGTDYVPELSVGRAH